MKRAPSVSEPRVSEKLEIKKCSSEELIIKVNHFSPLTFYFSSCPLPFAVCPLYYHQETFFNKKLFTNITLRREQYGTEN